LNGLAKHVFPDPENANAFAVRNGHGIFLLLWEINQKLTK
jgi:hypothetical protein